MKRREFLSMTAMAAALPLAQRNAQAAPRPNILFIMTDQQFADAMSCRMERQYIHTPAMDRLAKNGTLFTRAYAANALCVPQRCAIFTGLYPHNTGVYSFNPWAGHRKIYPGCFNFRDRFDS